MTDILKQKPDILGAVPPVPAYPPAGVNYASRPISEITDFVIHHSAGPTHQSPGDICAEHMARGMATIAYNWVIAKDGTIYQGRPISWASSANYGRNPESVAVCLIGNFQSDDPGYTGPPDPRQIKSLNDLALSVHIHLSGISRTYGHRDVESIFYPGQSEAYGTVCPGDQLYALIPVVKLYVTQNLHKGL
jgi:hypothetical protein